MSSLRYLISPSREFRFLYYLPLFVAPIYKYDFEFIENNESIFDVLLGEVLKGY